MNDYEVPKTIPEVKEAIERYTRMYAEYRGVRWEHVIVTRLKMLATQLKLLEDQAITQRNLTNVD